MPLAADFVIATLELKPHPEGGWFRETFRDAETSSDKGRPASTMIYYLLKTHDFSHIHRLDAAEGWHFYAGDAINVVEIGHNGATVTRMGLDFAAGERPQHLVPKDTWFGCSLADGSQWALLGCTVAPGFEFANFELGEGAVLMEQYPQCQKWINALTGSK